MKEAPCNGWRSSGPACPALQGAAARRSRRAARPAPRFGAGLLFATLACRSCFWEPRNLGWETKVPLCPLGTAAGPSPPRGSKNRRCEETRRRGRLSSEGGACRSARSAAGPAAFGANVCLPMSALALGCPPASLLHDNDLYSTTNKCLQCLLKIMYTVF